MGDEELYIIALRRGESCRKKMQTFVDAVYEFFHVLQDR